MNQFVKRLLLGSMILLFFFGAVGCDLFPTATTTVTTVSTTDTAATSTTTEPTTSVTTVTTTSVRDIAVVLSGTWRTVYEFGQAFDPTGLTVTLLRSDGTETVVTEYFVLGFSSSVSGLKTVRIRCNGLESSFVVYVKEATILADVALELVLPDKLVYQPGQAADWTGLVVSVVKSDGDRIAVPASAYAIAGFSSASSGLVTITVAYDDFTATFPIYVADPAVGGISLSVTPPTKTAYDVGDAFDPAGMTVSLLADGEDPIALTAGQYAIAAPNMAIAGTRDVLVSALGLEAYFSITVTAPFVDLMAYYDSAEGLAGQALFLELREIINTGFSGVTYGEARYILNISDRDPNNAANVILVYTGASVSGNWDAGVTWAREHVWPQSLLGASADNAIVNVCSDLQNLKPINPGVNSARSNNYFDLTTTGASYFPGDDDKGDIARILLYMVTMYDYLSLVNSAPSTYQMAMLDVLLLWNEQDPVDDFERNRNEVIFSYQDNRNPYIDYPEFVELIWG